MRKLRIHNNKGTLGITVEAPYKTVTGTEKYVSICVNEDGINVHATGCMVDLTASRFKASIATFKQAAVPKFAQ